MDLAQAITRGFEVGFGIAAAGVALLGLLILAAAVMSVFDVIKHRRNENKRMNRKDDVT